jgi:HEAT repeat protein
MFGEASMPILPRFSGLILLVSWLLFAQQPETPRQRTAKPEPQTAPAIEHLSPREPAWNLLETGVKADKTGDRSIAVRVLGLLPDNPRARKMAEIALNDDKAEVRASAASALGEMRSRTSIPQLQKTLNDDDPSVALAAAHALILLKDDSAYQVYYEILTGERKAEKGLIASETSKLSDPKKLAQLGFEEGIGYIPFAGVGWGAIKALTKDDTSPVRAAAAKVLAHDPDPGTSETLAKATGDKSWLVQAASLEALAKRGDPSVLKTIGLYMDDNKPEVKYTAAAAVLRLMDIRDTGKPLQADPKDDIPATLKPCPQ